VQKGQDKVAEGSGWRFDPRASLLQSWAQSVVVKNYQHARSLTVLACWPVGLVGTAVAAVYCHLQ